MNNKLKKIVKKRKLFYALLGLTSGIITTSTIAISCSQAKPVNAEEKNSELNNASYTIITPETAKQIINDSHFFKNKILDLSTFNNLKEIEANSFANIEIKKIIFPENLEKIGSNAFVNTNLEVIDLAKITKLKDIQKDAFANNKKLKINVTNKAIKILLKNSGIEDHQIVFMNDSFPNKVESKPVDEHIQDLPSDPSPPSNTSPLQPIKPTHLSPEKPVINNEIDAIKAGGTLSDLILSADSYLSVVNSLNLHNLNTKLSTLTNEKINELLHKEATFNNLNLTIANGSSETKGILKLHLTGKYNNKSIPANTIITITNFFTYESEFRINELNFNDENYFKDLQTKDQLSSWNDAQWLKYLSDIKVINSKANIIDLSAARFTSDFTLGFQYQNDLKVQIYGNLKLKEYENGSWILSAAKKFKIQNNVNNGLNLDLSLPNQKAAAEYIINNQINLKEKDSEYERLKENYASNLEQEFNFRKEGDNDLEFTLFDFHPTYKKYLKDNYNVENPAVNINSLFANDFTGEIFINFSLYDARYSGNADLATRSITVSGFESINNLIEKQKTQPQANNFVAPSNISSTETDEKEKPTSIWSKAKKEIKENFNIEELTKMEKNKPIILENSNPVWNISQNSKNIDLIKKQSGNANSTKRNFDFYNKNFNFKLLGKFIENNTSDSNFDFDKNLFFLNNKSFKIHSLSIDISKDTKAKLMKVSNGFYYQVNFTYQLELSAADKLDNTRTLPVNINAQYSLYFSYSDLGIAN